MSNPADPKKPAPDQPDSGSGSMFEFQLPDDAGSYSDPPSGRGLFGDFGLEPTVPPPGLIPADDAPGLPGVPAVPAPGDSAALLDLPAVPPHDSPALNLEAAELLGLTDIFPPIPEPEPLPELPPPGPGHEALADIDLDSADAHAPAEPGPLRPSSSGSTPELPAGGRRGGSNSFEFQLPSDVKTYSELPPVQAPDEIGSRGDFGVLPPPPPAAPRNASFDFIHMSNSRSFAALDLSGRTVDPEPPPGEPVEPVAPASGWLDAAAPPAPPAPVESSDIFAGRTAKPVGTSDVLSAPPGEPTRASDIALTFDAPPGGSTVHDGAFDDLPLADDLDGGSGRLDDESIHDMPALDADHPLFDSGTLANAPDLPAGPADAPDYGALPEYGPDASSILADLSTPEFQLDDASSVRVEAPGVDRTLTGAPSDAFDLTVPEEPIPAGLFGGAGDDDDDTGPESTDWQQQSGSDLLAQRRTAYDDDDGRVEPVDADLFGDQPSLSSAQSSIFSGPRPKGSSGSGGSSGRAPAAPGDDDFDLAEVAEFTDHPEPEPTVAAPAAGADESGRIDFDAAEPDDEDQRTRAAPSGVSLSALMRGELPDDSEEVAARTAATRPVRAQDAAPHEPEASVDYLAESAEASALVPPLPLQEPAPKAASKDKSKEKAKKSRTPEPPPPPRAKSTKSAAARTSDTGTSEKAKPAKKGGGLVVGALVGALAAGGACAAAYFGGVVPNSEKGPVVVNRPPGGPNDPVAPGAITIPPPPGAMTVPPPPGAGAAAGFDPQVAFAAGEGAKAVEHYKATPPESVADKANAGHIRVFAKVQAARDGAPIAADDPDLKAARANLQDVIADAGAVAEPGGVKRGVRASVALGVSYEVVGDTAAARKVYADAMARYPAYRSTFEALVDKLDAQAPPAGGTSRRLAPADAELLLLATAILLQDAPKAEDAEPGVHYWKAVALAGGGKYKEAVESIERAKEAHAKRARAAAGRGLNPLSDPLEQIFTRSCDELKAYWKLRGAVSGNPDMIAEVKRDGGAVAKALDAFTTASVAASAAEKEVAAARELAKKLKGEVTKLDKDVKASDRFRIEAEQKLEQARADVKAAEKKLDTAAMELAGAEKEVKAQKDVLVSLAEALKPVAPVPDKWGPGDLLPATRAVIARATGPDLKALVPSAMTAVGGGGLTAGQLLDIADRLTKSEAVAKELTAKLAAETKRLTDRYDTDTQKLKEERGADVKKLTDTYAADVKKLNAGHAEAVKALKDGSADEVRKLTDKYAADAKRLTDEFAAAASKLKDAHLVALKEEQDRTAAERKKAAARELEFQKQLAGSVTPGQVMDIWLPVLTDLRRVSDTGPALAAAQKAVDSSAPDSEDAAKARTVAGMAHLIRGDLSNAKELFQAARRSPAYQTAAGKPWAVAADTGLGAVADPAAPYRQPVALPPVDLKAAAAALDLGVGAYKGGRYDDAAKALLAATKNNPADPVAWYFLGAARWAAGNAEQARKDFAQGAAREKGSTLTNATTSAALTPIQGAVRDALDRARP